MFYSWGWCHLHFQEILCFGEVVEVLDHEPFGTLEEGGGAVGLRDGEERQAVAEIHDSDQEVTARFRQD